jgi:hypothetical protein
MRNQIELGVFEWEYAEEARQGRRTGAAASFATSLLGRWKGMARSIVMGWDWTMRNQVELGVFEWEYAEEAHQVRRTGAAASVATALLGRLKVKVV